MFGKKQWTWQSQVFAITEELFREKRIDAFDFANQAFSVIWFLLTSRKVLADIILRHKSRIIY